MFRKILFWFHLGAGLTAGVFIFLMSATGAALTYEKELIAWAERDARRVEVPANPARLPLEEMIRRARESHPDARIGKASVSSDPREAVSLSLPGNAFLCVNPYTGEVREAHGERMREFMKLMRGLHTRIATTIGAGGVGRTLNSAANVLFFTLTLTGLVLWWPRAWNLRVLRPLLWFVGGASGRFRNWNWHNVIGFWMLPVFFILTGTGVIMSYRWGNDLVYRVVGEKPINTYPPPKKPAPLSDQTAKIIDVDAMLALAQERFPTWSLISMDLPLPGTPKPQTRTASVSEEDAWPMFSTKSIDVDSVTGEVAAVHTYDELTTGQVARRWVRQLHSGEAFRLPGQTIAGLGCVFGCVMVWTGFALAWHRFFGGKSRTAESARNGSG